MPRILFGELQRSESSASRQVVQNLPGQYGQRLQQWLAQGQAQGQVALALIWLPPARCWWAWCKGW